MRQTNYTSVQVLFRHFLAHDPRAITVPISPGSASTANCRAGLRAGGPPAVTPLSPPRAPRREPSALPRCPRCCPLGACWWLRREGESQRPPKLLPATPLAGTLARRASQKAEMCVIPRNPPPPHARTSWRSGGDSNPYALTMHSQTTDGSRSSAAIRLKLRVRSLRAERAGIVVDAAGVVLGRQPLSRACPPRPDARGVAAKDGSALERRSDRAR
jgi:hypothetical protein